MNCLENNFIIITLSDRQKSSLFIIRSLENQFLFVSVETTFLTAPARQLCERDPCEVSMCLKLPMTKCLTSALCKPVYFDETGNVLNCTGKKIERDVDSGKILENRHVRNLVDHK